MRLDQTIVVISRWYEATSSFLLGFVYLSRRTKRLAFHSTSWLWVSRYLSRRCSRRRSISAGFRLGLEIATSQKKKEREKLIHLARNVEEIGRRIAHRSFAYVVRWYSGEFAKSLLYRVKYDHYCEIHLPLFFFFFVKTRIICTSMSVRYGIYWEIVRDI